VSSVILGHVSSFSSINGNISMYGSDGAMHGSSQWPAYCKPALASGGVAGRIVKKLRPNILEAKRDIIRPTEY